MPAQKTTPMSKLLMGKFFSSQTVFSGFVAAATLVGAADASALPQSGQVVGGAAEIAQSGSRLDVNQSSNNAIINWNSFGIGAAEHVNFNQPSSSSATLNRVTGVNPSEILGKLTSNGQIMLVNPNGVFFGKDATVDVASLVASTADIKNSDFMAGNYNFSIAGEAGASIVNDGTITISEGGIAAFVAPQVRNNGMIMARLGKVTLAGGDAFTLDLYGDELVSIVISEETAQQLAGQSEQISVFNSGQIINEGGTVVLTAATAKDVVESVINMDGVIQAQSVAEKGGKIFLSGGDVDIDIAGLLDASGKDGVDGGDVIVKGGGTTTFTGEIDASGGDGGFIELSGKNLGADGVLNAGGGHIFLDPDSLIVGLADSAGDPEIVSVATILSGLSGGATFDLAANITISVNAAIDFTGSGAGATLRLIDQDANGSLDINLNAAITHNSDQFLTGQGTSVDLNAGGTFQNAMDVVASGGTVNVGLSTFNITNEVDISKAVTIGGSGAGLSILDARTLTSGNALHFLAASAGSSLSNVSLLGNNVNTTGVRVEGNNTTVRNLSTSGFGTIVHGVGASNLTVRNNTLTTVLGDGIVYESVVGGTISGNSITAAADDAIVLNNSSNVAIDNSNGSNTIADSVSAGVYVYGTSSGNTITNNIFTNSLQGIINESSQDFNAETNSFDGTVASAMSTAQRFTLEDDITHTMDNAAYGQILYGGANDTYVTTNTLGIQRGIDVANATGTVYVNDGTYSEAITTNKDVTLQGTSTAGTIVNGLTNTDGVRVTSSGVTIDSMTFNGHATNSNDGVDIASTNATLTNTVVDGYQTAVRVSADNATLTSNTFNNGTTGLAVDSAFTTFSFSSNAFSGQSGQYINNTGSSDFSANGNTFGGTNPATLNPATDLAALFALEDRVTHKADNNAYGRVLFGNTSNAYYVTTNTAGIQNAINNAASGGTVYVNSGTYAETLDINTALTLQGNGSASTILDATGFGDGINVNVNNVTIDGFRLNGVQNAGNNNGIDIDSANATVISNNIISGFDAGVDINVGNANVIDDNTMMNSPYGIRINQGTNTVITDNTISGISNDGLLLNDTTTLTTFTGNAFSTVTDQHIVNQTASSFSLNGNTFDGVDPSAMTIPQLLALEDKVTHLMDNASYGQLLFGAANTLYATTSNLGIQYGIDNSVVGGTVHVGAGNFNENISLNKLVHVTGQGDGTNPAADTIVRPSDVNTAVLSITAGGTSTSNRLTVSEINFGGATGTNGIEITGGNFIELNNVTSNNNGGSGLFINKTTALEDVRIVDSTFNDNTKNGVEVPTTQAQLTGLTITGSTITGNTSHGLSIEGNGSATGRNTILVENTIIQNNGGDAEARFTGVNGGLTLKDSTFSSNGSTDYDVYISGSDSIDTANRALGTITIDGSSFDGAPTVAGLWIENGTGIDDLTFTGATSFNNTAPDGLHLNNITGGTFDLGTSTFADTNTRANVYVELDAAGTTPLVRTASTFTGAIDDAAIEARIIIEALAGTGGGGGDDNNEDIIRESNRGIGGGVGGAAGAGLSIGGGLDQLFAPAAGGDDVGPTGLAPEILAIVQFFIDTGEQLFDEAEAMQRLLERMTAETEEEPSMPTTNCSEEENSGLSQEHCAQENAA